MEIRILELNQKMHILVILLIFINPNPLCADVKLIMIPLPSTLMNKINKAQGYIDKR